MDIINQTSHELYNIILEALGQAVSAGKIPSEPIPPFSVEIPADSSNGDFSTNVAMVSAKALKMPPRKIAEIIKEEMNVETAFINDVEIARPGFINFFANANWFSNVVRDVLNKEENYGKSEYGDGKKVLVEFVSANPTGPMHIGNARGGAMGDALVEVLNWSGYSAKREFYVNDAGNQIDKFGISLNARYLQLIYGEDKVEFPENGYQGADIIEHVKNFYEIHGDKYKDCEETQRINALTDYALPLNITALKTDLQKYRIDYDIWFKESTLHMNSEVARIISLLKEKGVTYEKDGALWLKAAEYGCDQDFVLIRSNGLPTYIVPDIAYHYNKLEVRKFDKAINIWGADHHGYLPRLKASLKALGIDPTRLDIILMQMVRLIRDGEPVKVSKRTGKSITLNTLLDEVPIDAARFFFNAREANTHMDFDLNLAVEQSNKNPVYYVQYAHARISKILQKSELQDELNNSQDDSFLDLLETEYERELIRKIALLPMEIINAAKAYDPSRLTRYVTDVATAYHKFYDKCRVLGEEKNLSSARIMLCAATKNVIKNVLTILKIDSPENM